MTTDASPSEKPPDPATCPLVGRWRLVSYTERRDNGESFDVFGPNPVGHITYLASGYMSVIFASAQRKPFGGAWSSVSDAHKAANFDALVAYEGRFTYYADRVEHLLDVSWIPNWEGKVLIRYIRVLQDGKVRLSTPSVRFGRPAPVQDVVVERDD